MGPDICPPPDTCKTGLTKVAGQVADSEVNSIADSDDQLAENEVRSPDSLTPCKCALCILGLDRCRRADYEARERKRAENYNK